MTEHEASRTLVKSPPELWAECSAAASLQRHLEEFGEIQITRLEPETAVAWEGENASGTVRLEPSGWGTRVVLTARAVMHQSPEGPPRSDPLPPGTARPPRGGLIARLLGRFRPAPAPAGDAAPDPAPAPSDAPNPTAVLNAALDSLGQAHHRPFSRA